MKNNFKKILNRIIPDKVFLRMQYKYHFREKLNLKNPQTYNEKLQWLKLNDRKMEYSQYVDKYAVREFVSNTIGEEYLIPLIDVYNNVNEIEWENLPKQFVLKCTHGSTSNIICENKDNLDINEAKNKLEKWMKRNWFWYGREWPYKHVQPRIIAEKFMEDESGSGLKDYKFFCFNGEPHFMLLATDRGIDTKFDFFDMEFNKIPVKQHYKNNRDLNFEKPKGFDKMIELSKKLSANIPHLRVDFYNINGKIYFGELTFYHFSGYRKFEPQEYDEIFGSLLKLPIEI